MSGLKLYLIRNHDRHPVRPALNSAPFAGLVFPYLTQYGCVPRVWHEEEPIPHTYLGHREPIPTNMIGVDQLGALWVGIGDGVGMPLPWKLTPWPPLPDPPLSKREGSAT